MAQDKDLFEALNGVFGLFSLTTFEYGYALSVKDGAQMNSVCLAIPPGKAARAVHLVCVPALLSYVSVVLTRAAG